MALNRHSKIKEVWKHPIGHDVMQSMLQQSGRGPKWAQRPMVAHLPVTALDRFAWPGFADMLLEICKYETEPCPPAATAEHSWWKEAVVYQVFLPSFMDADHDGVGDLRGVLQRLPYLERLGVNVLWLRPMLETGSDGGVVDYRRVNSQYGDDADLEALLEAAHMRRMKVVMGMDINATSSEHPWFRQALEDGGAGETYYIFRSGTQEARPNNWKRPSGYAAWKWMPQRGAWALRVGGKNRMDLNWNNAALRAEMAGTLRFWRQKGIDGFYLEGCNLISKGSFEDGNPSASGLLGTCGFEKYGYGPHLHEYLRTLRAEGLEGDDDVLTVGGVRGLGTEMAKLMTGDARGELDMVLDSSHLRPRRNRRAGDCCLRLEDLKAYYLHWQEEYGDERWMGLYFENNETPRLISRVGASPLYRSILAKMMGTWLLTMRGTPILYQGEELGLANTRFSSADELRDLNALRQYASLCEQQGEKEAFEQVLDMTPDHARTPIPWSTGPCGGFTGAKPWMRLPDGVEYLNASVQMEDPCSVLNHYQRLVALRRQNAGLVYGRFSPVFANNKKVFCYFRILGAEKWYVEMNLTEKQVPRPGRILRTQRLELSNYDNPSRALRPYEANVYRCE